MGKTLGYQILHRHMKHGVVLQVKQQVFLKICSSSLFVLFTAIKVAGSGNSIYMQTLQTLPGSTDLGYWSCLPLVEQGEGLGEESAKHVKQVKT